MGSLYFTSHCAWMSLDIVCNFMTTFHSAAFSSFLFTVKGSWVLRQNLLLCCFPTGTCVFVPLLLKPLCVNLKYAALSQILFLSNFDVVNNMWSLREDANWLTFLWQAVFWRVIKTLLKLFAVMFLQKSELKRTGKGHRFSQQLVSTVKGRCFTVSFTVPNTTL